MKERNQVSGNLESVVLEAVGLHTVVLLRGFGIIRMYSLHNVY